ncbi:ATP-binding cassette domain-containing protein [Epibacterium ulvae]|uniref:phosphate ABC transporter ATP-binding protein n=1 Tax=Epibacterium ulvae TaxID=1156985 RepID=UPI001BFBFE5A|nr:ATP-binding cassette domain-containing protein [Epibacterium ulvae]MBT8153353.1 ATP-binding cassette domain-containing protein [Epibacterium ulvae]
MLDSLSIRDHMKTETTQAGPVISVRGLGLTFGRTDVLQDVSFDLVQGEVTCLLGAFGSGKSMLLRCLNRTAEELPRAKQTGTVFLRDRDVMDPTWDLPLIRRTVALIPEVHNPFPMSTWDNLAYVLRLHRLAKAKADQEPLIEAALRRVGIWDDVKDRLHHAPVHRMEPMMQRLICIARALMLEPQILLLDEPSSGTDCIDLHRLDALLADLKRDMSVVLSTPSLKVAANVSDRAAHLDGGRVLELDATELVLTNAQNPTTKAFVEAHC